MGAQCRRRAVAVPRPDGADDRIMFSQRVRAAPDRGKRCARHQRHRAVDKVQLLDEVAVMGRQVDLVVKPAIGAGQGFRITQKGTILFDHVLQDSDFLVGCMLRREPRREPLQFLAHGVKLGHLGMIEGSHDQRATVACQQRLRFQPLQRLTDGGATDPEAVRQLAFHQPRPGPIDAPIDRVEDQQVSVLLRRLGHCDPFLSSNPGKLGVRPAPVQCLAAWRRGA